MIRRRLFAYVMMMSAGIASGYLMTERSSLTGGLLVMLSTGLSAWLMLYAQSADALSRSKAVKECVLLTAFLAAGFMLFLSAYISYEQDLRLIKENNGYIHLEGKVRSVTFKEEISRIELTDPVIIVERPETNETVKIPVRHKILATYRNDMEDKSAIIGKRISVFGTLQEPGRADNPGCFDYQIYLRSMGIAMILKTNSFDILATKERFPDRIISDWHGHIFRIRESFLDSFEDEKSRGVLRGVIFGDKNEIDEMTRKDFDTNATGHLLAVSGLHMGFLYSLLRLLSGKKKTLPLTILIILVLMVYGDMTLWSASAVRADIVLTMNLMAFYVRRPFDLTTSVSTAALIMLIIQPYQLFHTGFQMSFLALLGIALISIPLAPMIGEYASVIIALQLSIAPVSAFVFHRLNLLSVFINIPIILMASVLVPACIGCLLLYMLTNMLPHLCVQVMTGLSGLLIWLNQVLTFDGSFSVLTAASDIGPFLMLYLLAFTLSTEWTRIRVIRKEYRLVILSLLCIMAVSASVYYATYNEFVDDEIVFVSVGQGDCTHIRCGHKNLLIDGGGMSDYNVGEDILMPYLLANKVSKVEMALVTHLHMDHYQGICELSQCYPVGRIGIPADYRRSLEQEDDPERIPDPKCIVYLRQNRRITVSEDVWIDPVWPVRSKDLDISIDDPNENNMVFIVNYKGVKVMVTGDLLAADEEAMISYYKGTDVLKCDILKVAHHGSKTSSSEEFIDAVSPSIAVIQVGRNNFYGHPHQQTLDRLEEKGILIYRTDMNGAVGIDIAGGVIKDIDLVRKSPS